ncbi:MAG: hypothetical protein K0Q95_2909 [Bacteroidota bacterium]|jgi:PKD repeat protein|nr:hypothetical protein [Bacteroidota bacterium]
MIGLYKRTIFILLICLAGRYHVFSQASSIVFPKNLMILNDSSVQFEWDHVKDVSNYRLQVALVSDFSTTLIDTVLAAESLSVELSFCSDYFCRTGTNTGSGMVWSSVISFSVFTPECYNSCKVWFAADSGVVYDTASNVEVWKNLVSADSAFQPIASKRPLYVENSLGGLPVVRFDGANDFLMYNINISVSSFFGVLNSSHTGSFSGYSAVISSSANPYLLYGNSGSTALYTQGFSNSQFFINKVPSNNFAPLGQNKVLSSTADPFSLNELFIGSAGGTSEFWKGDYSEIVLTDSRLTLSEFNKIHSYFYQKYSPPVNLGKNIFIPYGYCDTVLDAGSRFVSFLWSTGDTTQTTIVTEPGMYSVRVTDVFGQQSSDTIIVTYPGNLSFSDTTICYGNTFSLSTSLSSEGYNFQWQDNSNDSSIVVSSAGQYYVKVTDTLGCFTFSDTAWVTVDSFPVVASLGNDTALCAGNSLFLQSGASEVSSYLWQDGSFNDSLQIFSPGGGYWVLLNSVGGCTKTDSINISISGEAPVSGFLVSGVCIGGLTSFTDNSSPPSGDTVVTWAWDFGDAGLSSLQNPIHQYSDTGTYQVILKVTTNEGCSSSVVKNVRIYSLPIATFFASGFCEDAGASFNANAVTFNDGINSWSWNFADTASGSNNFSFVQNPGHYYTLPGTYPVSLIVTTFAGCSDTLTNNITIKQRPVAGFTNSIPCSGLATQFLNASSLPPATSLIASFWNFGDASPTSTLANPVHIYSAASGFNVIHVVTASNGCRDTIASTITVKPTPQAAFTSAGGCVGSSILFNDLSTVAPGNVSSWSWTFPNGTSMVQNPQHVFSLSGLTNIKLVVTSDQGCADTVQQTVVINPLPVASFNPSVDYGSPPLAVDFTNTSTGADSYVWNFDGVNGSNLSNPSFTFADTGTFETTLIASNIFGCADSVSHPIEVSNRVMDVAVTDLLTDIQNGFMNVTARFSNFGSTDIYTMEVYLKINDNAMLKINWGGFLPRNSSVNYIFTASSELDGDDHYVCVSVQKPNGFEDQNPANNELCNSVEKDNFTVFEVYPNPMRNILTLPLYLPSTDILGIELYDVRGEKVKVISDETKDGGFHKITYDVSELPKGFYILKYRFRDETVIQKIVKN